MLVDGFVGVAPPGVFAFACVLMCVAGLDGSEIEVAACRSRGVVVVPATAVKGGPLEIGATTAEHIPQSTGHSMSTAVCACHELLTVTISFPPQFARKKYLQSLGSRCWQLVVVASPPDNDPGVDVVLSCAEVVVSCSSVDKGVLKGLVSAPTSKHTPHSTGQSVLMTIGTRAAELLTTMFSVKLQLVGENKPQSSGSRRCRHGVGVVLSVVVVVVVLVVAVVVGVIVIVAVVAATGNGSVPVMHFLRKVPFPCTRPPKTAPHSAAETHTPYANSACLFLQMVHSLSLGPLYAHA